MLEVVVDAFLFEQATQKVERRFPVLHAYVRLGGAPCKLNRKSENPCSCATFLKMSSMPMSGKILQSALRVRNQNQGRAVARYW